MSPTLTCPICGRRNAYEFRFGGEDKGPRPDEEGMTQSDWCSYVHLNNNASGVQKEWWYHREGCGTWFTAHRDTRTNLQVIFTETDDAEDPQCSG